MANTVLEVVELRAGQSGNTDKDRREWVRVFRVTLETHEHGPVYACFGNISIPTVGDPHPLDALALVRTVRVEKANDVNPVYDVTVRYSTEWAGYLSPVHEPANVQWGFTASQEVVTRDVFTGQHISASTGELLVPGIEQDVHRLTLRVTRNEWAYSAVMASTYIGKVNSDYTTICGLPITPGKALCRNFAGTAIHTNEWNYFRVEYELEFNVNTFSREVLDHGTYYYDSSGNKQVFRDGGEQSTRPHLLNGAGGMLPDGSPPVYLEYFTRKQIAFAALGLDI